MGIVAKFPDAQERLKKINLASRQELLNVPRSRVLHIEIPVGSRTPPECHAHVTKRIVILEGCASIVLQNATQRILEGEDTIIPFGTLHRIENNGKIPLTILEVRTGTYLDDDDQLEM